MVDRLPDSLASYEREALQDACGIVGLLSSQDMQLSRIGLAGLAKLQTRGYDGAGYTGFRSDGAVLFHKAQGTIGEVFPPGVVTKLDENLFYHGQWQVRYGTSGRFSSENVQPFITAHHLTQDMFTVSHNGQFSRKKGEKGSNESDTAGFVSRLAQSQDKTWDARIINTLAQEGGAWSLIIGVKDHMYLARDPFGFRPLYFSQKKENGNYLTMAASETEALLNAGFQHFKEVMPGQIVKFNRHNSAYTVAQITESTGSAHCMFENVYTQDERTKALLPRDGHEAVNNSFSVREVRERCGRQLAIEAPISSKDIDMAIGIPGTGITGGEAYAKALGIPYTQAIKDKHTPGMEQRTFMQADIEGIMKKVQEHFKYDYKVLAGKRVVLIDDSIVRGNISKGLVDFLKNYCGVSEVHLRVLCPPIDKPCHLGINTRTKDELIASKFTKEAQTYDELIELIKKDIGANSLAYLSDTGLLWAATGDPHAKGFCMGCMVGRKHPIDQYGQHP